MSLGSEKRRRVLARDRWMCRMPACLHPDDDGGRTIVPGLPQGHPWAASVDHIVPRSMGGTDRMENLRAAHFWCNKAAAEQMPHQRRRLPWREWDNVEEVPPYQQWAEETDTLTRNMRPDVYERLRQAERDGHAEAGEVP